MDKHTKKFLKEGYIISKIENKKNFNIIQDFVAKSIKRHLKLKKKISINNLFNNLHKFIDKNDINNLRVKVYNELNSKKNLINLYFSLAETGIETIVGSELASQSKINFSIQIPHDKNSKLEMHADSLSGESKFQVVLWVPLVNVFGNKSMYIFDKKLSVSTINKIERLKYNGLNSIYQKNKKKKKFLKVKKGEYLIFSPNLLHGNITNTTEETRISMNSRFKNLFSNYADKSKFGKRLGYFYQPLKIKPITKFSLNFNIPNEFK
ncbi:hypothetical protein OA430_00595 [Candidatus Pelagibacter sp.]|nr:hypothetical protein [Candidatus Pelagibacter sp.]